MCGPSLRHGNDSSPARSTCGREMARESNITTYRTYLWRKKMVAEVEMHLAAGTAKPRRSAFLKSAHPAEQNERKRRAGDAVPLREPLSHNV